MYAFGARLLVLSLAIAIPMSGQQPKAEPIIVGEIRAFAFDPTVEPGKTAYAKLAD